MEPLRRSGPIAGVAGGLACPVLRTFRWEVPIRKLNSGLRICAGTTWLGNSLEWNRNYRPGRLPSRRGAITQFVVRTCS